jgi:hypothetical protein
MKEVSTKQSWTCCQKAVLGLLVAVLALAALGGIGYGIYRAVTKDAATSNNLVTVYGELLYSNLSSNTADFDSKFENKMNAAMREDSLLVAYYDSCRVFDKDSSESMQVLICKFVINLHHLKAGSNNGVFGGAERIIKSTFANEVLRCMTVIPHEFVSNATLYNCNHNITDIIV